MSSPCAICMSMLSTCAGRTPTQSKAKRSVDMRPAACSGQTRTRIQMSSPCAICMSMLSTGAGRTPTQRCWQHTHSKQSSLLLCVRPLVAVRRVRVSKCRRLAPFACRCYRPVRGARPLRGAGSTRILSKAACWYASGRL